MARLALREEDIIRISLEFLYNRELHISQLSVERETGVINGVYSDDVLFLRQLVLDGQWDDVLEFIQPLEALPSFDMRQFKYTILRHKYIELLCIKSEAGGITVGGSSTVEGAVEEVVQVLNLLEKLAPSKEEYSGLCLLLTLPRLADHMNYKDWNPSKARVQCFKEVYPLVEKFLPGDKKVQSQQQSAKNDRLIQLVIKGLLYESCVNYCQTKATGGGNGNGNGPTNNSATDSNSQKTDLDKNEISFCKVLDCNNGFTDSDLSLLSWLQSIPTETFSVPFEQKTLNVDVERLEKPSLETSWTEHMLITPIKPKTFPHSVIFFTRPKSAADIMTRSLLPSFEGGSLLKQVEASQSNEMFPGGMSRSSFASFHLTGIKPSSGKMMTSSVDRLFESDGEVFLSNTFNEYQVITQVLFNQFLLTILVLLATNFLLRRMGPSNIRVLPTLDVIIIDLLVIYFFWEMAFYYSHRLFHTAYFYQKIHKVHHEWTSPIAITSQYCHPIEHICSNILPGFIGILLRRSHPVTIYIWITWDIYESLKNHCGYRIPYLPSCELHDYHHMRYNQCFGVWGIFDWLHGTDGDFVNTPAYSKYLVARFLRKVFTIRNDKKVK